MAIQYERTYTCLKRYRLVNHTHTLLQIRDTNGYTHTQTHTHTPKACKWPSHMCQNVVAQVLQQLGPVVLGVQEVPALLRECAQATVRRQEYGEGLVKGILHKVYHSCVLYKPTHTYLRTRLQTQTHTHPHTYQGFSCIEKIWARA